MFDLPDALARLEQSEYTGENRCYPCTAVNVALSLALATGIGAAVSPPVGVLALGVSLALVRFRGYLVPGTPTLTRRYLPERVLERFGKSPTSEPTAETVTPAELERVLTAAGTFELEGRRRVRWESAAALAADAAAAAELESRIDGWNRLEADERRDLLTGLRLLRDRCPACGGLVTVTTERLEHCCRRPRTAVRAACDECGGTLVDFSVAESRATPWLELTGAESADNAGADSAADV